MTPMTRLADMSETIGISPQSWSHIIRAMSRRLVSGVAHIGLLDITSLTFMECPPS
jgi:hypothetical protein